MSRVNRSMSLHPWSPGSCVSPSILASPRSPPSAVGRVNGDKRRERVIMMVNNSLSQPLPHPTHYLHHPFIDHHVVSPHSSPLLTLRPFIILFVHSLRPPSEADQNETRSGHEVTPFPSPPFTVTPLLSFTRFVTSPKKSE